MDRLDIQSNILLLARQDMNIYEKRIFLYILRSFFEASKEVLSEQKKSQEISIRGDLFSRNATITYRLKDLDPERNYARIKNALHRLNTRSISEVMSSKDMYYIGCMIKSAHLSIKGDTVDIEIEPAFYRKILDFSQGYTNLTLNLALKFQSIYTVRIYELIAKWRSQSAFQYNLDEFRRLLNIENKFKVTKDIKRNCLDIAKKELDASGDTDLKFSYEDIKVGRTITGFKFHIHKTANDKTDLMKNEAKLHRAEQEDKHMAIRDQAVLDFVDQNGIGLLGDNLALFSKFCQLNGMGAIKKLNKILDTAIKKGANNIPAYIVAAVRKDVEPKAKRAEVNNLISDLANKFKM